MICLKRWQPFEALVDFPLWCGVIDATELCCADVLSLKSDGLAGVPKRMKTFYCQSLILVFTIVHKTVYALSNRHRIPIRVFRRMRNGAPKLVYPLQMVALAILSAAL